MSCRVINYSWMILVFVIGCFAIVEAITPGCELDVPDVNRIDCGYPGMNDSDCESRRGCCWKPSQDQSKDTPYCFFNSNVTSEIKTETVCEHHLPIHLSCGTDHVIDVFNVFFGYHGKSQCHLSCDTTQFDCSPCYNPNGLQIVNSLCKCKGNCSVPTNGTTWHTGSKCDDFNHEARIQYRCIQRDPIACPIVQPSTSITSNSAATSTPTIASFSTKSNSLEASPTLVLPPVNEFSTHDAVVDVSRTKSTEMSLSPSSMTANVASTALGTSNAEASPRSSMKAIGTVHVTSNHVDVVPSAKLSISTAVVPPSIVSTSSLPSPSDSESSMTDNIVTVAPLTTQVAHSTSSHAEAFATAQVTSSEMKIVPSIETSANPTVVLPQQSSSTLLLSPLKSESSKSYLVQPSTSIGIQETTVNVPPPIGSIPISSETLLATVMISEGNSVATSSLEELPRHSTVYQHASSNSFMFSSASPVAPPRVSTVKSSDFVNTVQASPTSFSTSAMSSVIPEAELTSSMMQPLGQSTVLDTSSVESSMPLLTSTSVLPPVIPPMKTSLSLSSKFPLSRSSADSVMTHTAILPRLTSSAMLPVIPPEESTSAYAGMSADITSAVSSSMIVPMASKDASSAFLSITSSELNIPVHPTSSIALPEVSKFHSFAKSSAGSSPTYSIRPSTTVPMSKPSSTSVVDPLSTVSSSASSTPPLPPTGTTTSATSSAGDGMPTTTVNPSSTFSTAPSSSIGGGGVASATGDKEKLKPIALVLIIISILIVIILISLAVYFYRKRTKSRNFLCYKGAPLYNISYRYLETYFPESGKYVPMEASAIQMGNVRKTSASKDGYANVAIDKE